MESFHFNLWQCYADSTDPTILTYYYKVPECILALKQDTNLTYLILKSEIQNTLKSQVLRTNMIQKMFHILDIRFSV